MQTLVFLHKKGVDVMRIAILMTVHNRKAKTIACLQSLQDTWVPYRDSCSIEVFLTDDGCTDGTPDAIARLSLVFPVTVLDGDGSLFWNGGMLHSWKAALAAGGFDGFLWLNDDVVVLPEFWPDLREAFLYARAHYGREGIYVGSTCDAETGAFTYGGFVYTNKLTLKDKMLPPDGTVQPCQVGHGNITYVSAEVVDKMGIFCDKYIHGGTDHDYTYLAWKAGFPVLVLPHYSAACKNDHSKDGNRPDLFAMPLKQRLSFLNSPRGLNLHNALLFSRRCFPWRYPLILATGYFKALCPKLYYRIYLRLRGVNPPEWSK